MKKNNLLFAALLMIVFQQKANSQCTASITNVPHGDCANTDIELIASGGGTANGYSYQWTGPQGFTSIDQTVNIYYAQEAASGVYKVIVTNPGGCSASDSTVVIKHPTPIVYTGGQQGGCYGETSSIYAQDFSGNYGPYTYLWDNGATTQTISISHNGSVYPAPACFMTNVFGCTAANNTTFLIYTFPSPTTPVIEALSATSFCDGGSVTITTANDPNLTYQWNKHVSAINGATNSNFTATHTGYYSLTATNNMGCTAHSNTVHVTVFPKPIASITAVGSLNICNGDSVLLKTTDGIGYTYQWKKYSTNINNATSSGLYVKKQGNYRVLVTTQNGCTKMPPLVAVTSNCKVDAETRIAQQTASVYPNPSSNFFNLDLSMNDDNQNAELIITDMTGRIVSENNIQNNTANFQFGENLPAGIYNAALVLNNEVQNFRIVKTE